jgi:hypothetical protein
MKNNENVLTSLESDTDESDEDAEHIPVTDGMVDYAKPSRRTHESETYFGDSSTFGFAMNIKASVMANGQNLTAKRVVRVSGLTCLGTGRNLTNKRTDSDHTLQDEEDDLKALKSHLDSSIFQSLPQRHVARLLLERYFTAAHPIWPFLSEDRVRYQFEQTWSSEDPPNSIWIAQLNLIFCMACQLFERDLDRRFPFKNIQDVSEQFYQRARGFIIANAFNKSSVGMLQALLLMVLYQQGTMRSHQCWLTIGHATRMAQELGLHKELRSGSTDSPLDLELNRRLWWGCFCLDR